MKKFMFSAVALVAFSFAGMANNSVEKVEKETKEEKATVVVGKCDTIYSEVFAMHYNGNNAEQAAERAAAVTAACKAIHGEAAVQTIE